MIDEVEEGEERDKRRGLSLTRSEQWEPTTVKENIEEHANSRQDGFTSFFSLAES